MTSPLHKKELLLKKHSIIKAIRHFFEEERAFIEVITPTLVTNPGLEPHLEYFDTDFIPSMDDGPREKFFLPTSPEYHLKKALALGLERIYEITPSFRNGERSPKHSPEFLMLEWYRHPGNYKEIAKDLEELCTYLAARFSTNPQRWEKAQHFQVCELFDTLLEIPLRQLLREEKKTELPRIAFEKGLIQDVHLTYEDCFHFLMVDQIEASLADKGLCFLWDYPADFAALSRPKKGEEYLAERFECYFDGVELANAFGELTDPVEQRKRCLADLEERKRLYPTAPLPALDEDFLKALESLEDAGGIAVGVERLIMCLLGLKRLQDLRF